MLVAREARDKGVGSALMATALAWADGHGIAETLLAVFPNNDAALALYRRYGFVDAELKQNALPRRGGERWDLLIMRRTRP
jgi:ribosomal protein S18 acetylase RimI-like enzyme